MLQKHLTCLYFKPFQVAHGTLGGCLAKRSRQWVLIYWPLRKHRGREASLPNRCVHAMQAGIIWGSRSCEGDGRWPDSQPGLSWRTCGHLSCVPLLGKLCCKAGSFAVTRGRGYFWYTVTSRRSQGETLKTECKNSKAILPAWFWPRFEVEGVSTSTFSFAFVDVSD